MPGRLTLLLAAWLALGGCGAHGAAGKGVPLRTLEIREGETRVPNHYGLPLATGQILLGDGGGPISALYTLFPEKYQTSIHAGILALEDDGPHVYEAMGRLMVSLARRPTDAVRGRIFRTPLELFVQRQRFVEVYDLPPSVDPGKVAAYARDHHRRRTPFDPYFDFEDHGALCCTEFVALALEAGGAPLPELSPFRRNPSLTLVREWLGISPAGLIPAAALVDADRYVGTLSTFSSLTTLRMFFALKRELHLRFTEEQRLGNIFRWTGGGLRFREEIQDYLVRGMTIFPDDELAPDRQRIAAAAHELAAELFGPLPTSEGGMPAP